LTGTVRQSSSGSSENAGDEDVGEDHLELSRKDCISWKRKGLV
jgi:hypothetical protein